MPFTDWLTNMANEYVIAYNNVETGETILKPMSDEEIAQREAEIAAWLEVKAKREADSINKANAKKELLSKLGLTEDEAKLLLS